MTEAIDADFLNDNEGDRSALAALSQEDMQYMFSDKKMRELEITISNSNPRFRDLPMESRMMAIYLLNKGKVEAIRELDQLLYKRRIPTMEEFLSLEYCGAAGHSIYDVWREALIDFFDEKSTFYEMILTGAIGIGKSTIALVGHHYNLFRVNCYKYPQLSMNVGPTTPMLLQLMSVTLDKASKTQVDQMVTLLESCSHYVRVGDKEEATEVTESGDPRIPWWREGVYYYFPNEVGITAGSSDQDAIGFALFGASLDEAEFRRGGTSDKVYRLYSQLRERVQSRFKGSRSIFLTMMSSAQSETGIMAQYIKGIPADDPDTKVYSYPIWDVKFPREMEKGHFWCLRGTNSHPSRLLSDNENIIADQGNFMTPSGCEIFKVPITYKRQFSMNIDQAMMNLAGKTTVRDEKPFDDLSMIVDENLADEVTLVAELKRAVDSEGKPIRLDQQPLYMQLPIEKYCTKTAQGWVMKRYPLAPRYVHCDLADTGEAGIAIVHKEIAPNGGEMVITDFVTKIVSPNRISIELVDNFLMDLSRVLNMNVMTLTADQYQSVSTLQRAQSYGAAKQVKRLSVDTDAKAYRTLSNLIAEGLFKTGKCVTLEAQLDTIFFDKNKPYAHDGRKDVADGVCGAVYNAILDASSVPINAYERFDHLGESFYKDFIGDGSDFNSL